MQRIITIFTIVALTLTCSMMAHADTPIFLNKIKNVFGGGAESTASSASTSKTVPAQRRITNSSSSSSSYNSNAGGTARQHEMGARQLLQAAQYRSRQMNAYSLSAINQVQKQQEQFAQGGENSLVGHVSTSKKRGVEKPSGKIIIKNDKAERNTPQPIFKDYR